ncbi:YheU family protein [Candidatus Njordibacter sp. Uisw_058]|uniref:YheU family protein n=1 Tax=Candidatus Njordibacter sp. Uisw_058 TaxID=3230974 RepID=UPI003D3C63CB
MIVPWQQINTDTLHQLLEEFASRDGTDYGAYETSLADKVSQLEIQLKQKRILVVYSELHESINIVPAEQFTK